jgi:hypothetical protein
VDGVGKRQSDGACCREFFSLLAGGYEHLPTVGIQFKINMDYILSCSTALPVSFKDHRVLIQPKVTEKF